MAAAVRHLCEQHPIVGNPNNPKKAAGMAAVARSREQFIKVIEQGYYHGETRLIQRAGMCKLPSKTLLTLYALIYASR